VRHKTGREFPALHPLKFNVFAKPVIPKRITGQTQMDLPSQHVARVKAPRLPRQALAAELSTFKLHRPG